MKLQPDHLKGSINELVAAQYFLKEGHQVYFPVVQQGKVDMIIEKFESQSLARVQVKTAYWNIADGYKYLQCRVRTTNGDQRLPSDLDYEFLVIVYENEMWIIPAELVTSSNITLRDEKRGRPEWDKYKIGVLNVG